MDSQFILSLSYYAASVFYLAAAIYAYISDPHSKQSIYLTYAILALAFWSFMLSLASYTDSAAAALLWNKMSLLAGLSFYTFVLLFSLKSTRQDLCFSWRCKVGVVFLPLLLFVIYSKGTLFAQPIQLVKFTRFGYVVNTVNVYWNSLFSSYYISYLALSIFAFIKWHKRLQRGLTRWQVMLIIVTFSVSFLLSLVIDSYLYLYKNLFLPPFDIFMILPSVALILFILLRYRVLLTHRASDHYSTSFLISVRQKIRLYNLVAYLYIFGAVWGYGMACYFIPVSKRIIYLSSLYCLFTGIVIIVVNVKYSKNRQRDRFLNYLIAASIPLIILPYYSTFSVTVWAFSILLLFLGILFNDNHMIVDLSAASLITLFALALLKPTGYAKILIDDHIMRIFVMVVAIVLAARLRKQLAERLVMLKESEAYQKTVFEVSQKLLFSDISSKHIRFENALQTLRNYLAVDCIFIYRFSNNGRTINLLASDAASGCRCLPPQSHSEDWILTLFNEQMTLGSAQFDQAVKRQQSHLIHTSINALYLPLYTRNEALGMLGFWSEGEIACYAANEARYMSFSNIFSNALAKLESLEVVEHMAKYDGLTGLPNRVYFKEQLNRATQSYVRFAVAFFDMDAFKNINDTRGHALGDQLLIDVARRLVAASDETMFVARMAGDEFVVLFKAVKNRAALSERLTELLNRLREPYLLLDEQFNLTFSVGVSLFPDCARDGESLLSYADLAMYQAKKSGKNKYIICSEALIAQSMRNDSIVNALKFAIENEELALYYQPIVDLQSEGIVAVEALLRWRHPEFAALSPSEFIPLAEESRAIAEISKYVFEQALASAVAWRESYGDITVSLNISAKQFKDQNFVAYLLDAVKGLSGRSAKIDFQITEAVYIDERSQIQRVLKQLKSLGAQISLDDFGSDYMSLQRLTESAIDCVKIDIHYIAQIGRDERADAMIKAMIALSHAIGAKVVAEGVETKQQRDFLKKHHCDFAQGYFFYRPMPKAAVDALLQSLSGP